jgi:hypothetical protein
LHVCDEAPVHCAPPPLGAGFVHERDCVPVPQVAVQVVQAVQPPLTTLAVELLPAHPTDGAKPMRLLPTSKTVMNVFMKLQPKMVWLDGAMPEQKRVRPSES